MITDDPLRIAPKSVRDHGLRAGAGIRSARQAVCEREEQGQQDPRAGRDAQANEVGGQLVLAQFEEVRDFHKINRAPIVEEAPV